MYKPWAVLGLALAMGLSTSPTVAQQVGRVPSMCFDCHGGVDLSKLEALDHVVGPLLGADAHDRVVVERAPGLAGDVGHGLVLVFIGILFFGWWYVIKKGAVNWAKE